MNDEVEIAAVLFEDLVGAVGAAIVHHDDGEAQVFIGEAFEDAAQQVADIGLFVIGGENHDDAGNPVRLKGGRTTSWR